MPAPASENRSNGNREAILLAPYILLTSIYMFTFQTLNSLPPETLLAAVTKAAPVWYLAAYVGFTSNFADNPLALGTRAGLVLSSVGDICLVWRTTLFLPGMFFFALAQMGYIYGLKARQRRGQHPSGEYVRESALACVLCYLFVFTGMDSWLMAVCVLGYSALLFAMANLALQRHLAEGDTGSWYGAVGGMSFVISDLLIALNKWKLVLPFSEGLIMVTYYVAQGAIAYGVVTSERVKQRN